MKELRFIKMHGCGNDYVFMDCVSQQAPANSADLAIRVSDRHRSIGGDGLVLMLPSDTADIRMQMFNSDGSEGAMCGNAIRCIAMWLHQSYISSSDLRSSVYRIQTKHRIVEARVMSSDSSRRSAVVRANMGPPVHLTATVDHASGIVHQQVLKDVIVAGSPAAMSCVSMGNPHAVLFVADLNDISFEQNGPAIERHAVFPDRTNVEFVQPTAANAAVVRVWERGSGETMACGSGACAVGVAGITAGVFREDQPVRIAMRGGQLTVSWPDRKDVFLQGPAEESFRGTISVAD